MTARGGTDSLTEQLLAHLLVLLRVATADQVEEARARGQERGERLGAALVALGHASAEAVEGALREVLGLAGRTRPRLGEILVASGHLTREGLQQGLSLQARNGRRLGEVLVELGLCTYAQVYAALEQQGRGGPLPAGTTPTPAGARRVAVVDDSPIALAMLESGLAMAGFQVHTYSEPHAALMGLLDTPVDIVLTDMEMPGMNGLELCRRVKEGPFRPLPVIILTANEEDTLRVKGLRAGAEDYVNKAASLEELAARIEGVLRRAEEAQRVRHVFARYTSAAVVEEALKRPTEVALEGERREVTVLFADLRRFTPLAEALPPEQTVSVLNEVLRRLADAVLTCGGTLDKFLGDGLMAVWGAPVQRPDDPLRALQAAKMMMASVEELKRGPEQGTFAQVELGVGLNTGLVVAGNVGSAQRTEYTCIGDAVNVAARLCGLAAPGDILLGERTWRLVAGHGHFEALAPVQLKGKSHPVPLWRVRRE